MKRATLMNKPVCRKNMSIFFVVFVWKKEQFKQMQRSPLVQEINFMRANKNYFVMQSSTLRLPNKYET